MFGPWKGTCAFVHVHICVIGVESLRRKEDISVAWHGLAPDFYCSSLLNFGLGKSCLVMHFCHVFLCPQEKLDPRKAVMKLICSYLSFLF